MVWFQDFAGHAEDLLNKIDKNAATLLNESMMESTEIEIQPEVPVEVNQSIENEKLRSNDGTFAVSQNSGVYSQESVHKIKRKADDRMCDTSELVDIKLGNKKVASFKNRNLDDSTDKSDFSDRHSERYPLSAGYVNNSMISAEDLNALQDKLENLNEENHQLREELLNIKYQHSQLNTEATNLRYQIEYLTKQLSEAEREKNIYIARAKRILQEKEKTVALKQPSSMRNADTESAFAAYIGESRKEFELERQRFKEVYKKNSDLISDLHALQRQHQAIQSGFEDTLHSLQMELQNERLLRGFTENDYKEERKAIDMKEQEYVNQAKLLEQKDEEIRKLQEQLQKQITTVNREDVEEKIKSLTQTLMTKQDNLEATVIERNVLRFQLEKVQTDYQRVLSQLNRSQDKTVLIEDKDLVHFPKFMRVYPFDASVIKKVKRAYSSLDAVSIRTGLFLRRYTLARVFVSCYMVLLHIWVLIILFISTPSIR